MANNSTTAASTTDIAINPVEVKQFYIHVSILDEKTPRQGFYFAMSCLDSSVQLNFGINQIHQDNCQNAHHLLSLLYDVALYFRLICTQ